MDATDDADVRVVTSPAAARRIAARGGRVYVWADSSVCCGGTRFIRTSTDAPADADRFRRMPSGDLEVFVRPAGTRRLPDELRIDLGGVRRRRVRASWDGCAFLV